MPPVGEVGERQGIYMLFHFLLPRAVNFSRTPLHTHFQTCQYTFWLQINQAIYVNSSSSQVSAVNTCLILKEGVKIPWEPSGFGKDPTLSPTFHLSWATLEFLSYHLSSKTQVLPWSACPVLYLGPTDQ